MEGTVDERLTTRLGFLLTGAFLFSVAVTNWYRGQIYLHPEVVVALFITYGIAFTLLFLAVVDYHRIEKYRIIIFLSLIFSLVFSTYVIVNIMSLSYGGDPLVFSHYSASLTLERENPYLHSMLPAYKELAISEHVISPTLSGETLDRIGYPALSFLLYVPFLWVGISDIRWVTMLFYIAAFSLIYFKSPKLLKPVILLPLFIIPSIIDNVGGNNDIIWVVPLILMVIYMRRTPLSGVLYGPACAFKQTPWFLAPFLLIWLWKSNESLDLKHRLIKLGEFSAISGATFLSFNLPFIINDPNSWYLGVLTPLVAGVVPHGSGLSILSQLAWVSLPGSFYTMSMVVVFLTLLVNYYIHFDRIKYALWVFPAIIFWFSYRSLDNYFIFWVPLLLISFSMWYASLPAQKRGVEGP